MVKNTVKIFKSRDSATSVLRKLGIKQRDYDFFIDKMEDGRFACQVTRAETHLESLKSAPAKRTVLAPVANPKPVPKKKLGKTPGPNRGIGAFAREMINDGKSNQEIWEALKETFNLDDSKKYYPTWYRCEMKRKAAAAA